MTQAEQDDWRCAAAQIPQGQRKHDWNDLHQLEQLTDEKLKEVRYHGSLLIAKTAGEKGLLMYSWRERQEFYFGFNSNLYWFAGHDQGTTRPTELSESESIDIRALSDFELREKALRSGRRDPHRQLVTPGAVLQRNEITDEPGTTPGRLSA